MDSMGTPEDVSREIAARKLRQARAKLAINRSADPHSKSILDSKEAEEEPDVIDYSDAESDDMDIEAYRAAVKEEEDEEPKSILEHAQNAISNAMEGATAVIFNAAAVLVDSVNGTKEDEKLNDADIGLDEINNRRIEIQA